MTKFTKGPWKVVSRNGYPVIRKQFNEYHHIDICNAVHGYMYSEKYDGISELENQEANANLIAAAPAMYEALDTYVRWMSDEIQIGGCNIHEKMVSALAKARGEK